LANPNPAGRCGKILSFTPYPQRYLRSHSRPTTKLRLHHPALTKLLLLLVVVVVVVVVVVAAAAAATTTTAAITIINEKCKCDHTYTKFSAKDRNII
jgi:hypothetical protein